MTGGFKSSSTYFIMLCLPTQQLLTGVRNYVDMPFTTLPCTSIRIAIHQIFIHKNPYISTEPGHCVSILVNCIRNCTSSLTSLQVICTLHQQNHSRFDSVYVYHRFIYSKMILGYIPIAHVH